MAAIVAEKCVVARWSDYRWMRSKAAFRAYRDVFLEAYEKCATRSTAAAVAAVHEDDSLHTRHLRISGMELLGKVFGPGKRLPLSGD